MSTYAQVSLEYHFTSHTFILYLLSLASVNSGGDRCGSLQFTSQSLTVNFSSFCRVLTKMFFSWCISLYAFSNTRCSVVAGGGLSRGEVSM